MNGRPRKEVGAAETPAGQMRHVVSEFSHDISNALAVALGFTQALLADGPESGSQRDDLLEIEQATREALALTQSLSAQIEEIKLIEETEG